MPPESPTCAIETIADKNDLCGESPLWNPNSEILYWVDITGRRLHRYSLQESEVQTTAPPIGISALALTDSATLIAAGSEGIWSFREGRPPNLIAKQHAGEVLAINDAIADSLGRLLAGSSFFNGSTDGYPLGKIYSMDTDGTVSVLDDGFHLANGMGFSGDARILYATDSIARVIYAYDYDPASGIASQKRILVNVPIDAGLPDGLTVDAEGFIWSANWFGGSVRRYDPDGRLERTIAIPAEQVSSVTFGGPEFCDLFITTAAEWDGLAFAPPNYSTEQRHAGGQLFHLKPEIKGKPEYVCRIQGE